MHELSLAVMLCNTASLHGSQKYFLPLCISKACTLKNFDQGGTGSIDNNVLLNFLVKEKEDAHADPEIQPMKEDDGTFGEYR